MDSEDLARRFCVLSPRGGGSIDFLAAATMLNGLKPSTHRDWALKQLYLLQTSVSKAIEIDMLSKPDPIAEELGRAAADTIETKMAANAANSIRGEPTPPAAPK